MSQYILPNPYDAGYAIPDYVQAEPPGRGTFTSKGLTRGTISATAFMQNWDGGYQLPNYVQAEPWGQGTFGTKGPVRGTIQQNVPFPMSGFGDPRLGGVLGGVVMPDGPRAARARGALGNYESMGAAGTDPITNYGQQAAAIITTELAKVPAAQQRTALKGLFDKIDTNLWKRVRAKTKTMPAKDAIAAAFSEGALSEMVALGKGAKPTANSYVGMGACGCHANSAEPMGDWLGSIGSFFSTVIPALGSAACAMARSPLTGTAASAGAGPVGAIGAQAASGACGGTPGMMPGQVPYYPPPQPDITPYLLLGGAVLAVVLLVK